MKDVRVGATIEVTTKHTVYTIKRISWDDALIKGHPQFCPEPVHATISGSTWGGSMIWNHFIGRGMHLEFVIQDVGRVTTSQIVEIRELAA